MIKALIILAGLLLSYPAAAQRAELLDAMKQPWRCGLIDSASIAFGHDYIPGVYPVTLQSDTGLWAAAKVTVGPSGAVTDVAFISQGGWYTPGSVLTAADLPKLPNGSGFALTILAVHDLPPGFAEAKDSTEHKIVARAAGDNPCPHPVEEKPQ